MTLTEQDVTYDWLNGGGAVCTHLKSGLSMVAHDSASHAANCEAAFTKLKEALAKFPELPRQ